MTTTRTISYIIRTELNNRKRHLTCIRCFTILNPNTKAITSSHMRKEGQGRIYIPMSRTKKHLPPKDKHADADQCQGHPTITCLLHPRPRTHTAAAASSQEDTSPRPRLQLHRDTNKQRQTHNICSPQSIPPAHLSQSQTHIANVKEDRSSRST